MKIPTRIFIACALCVMPYAVFGVCNTPNLVKCLDSACGINVMIQPGARCALCGTPAAADAVKQKTNYKFGQTGATFQAITIGASAATTISADDMKNAPTDPGARYSWAIDICIKQIADCTADDATKNYDSLIQKSCEAVLTKNELAKLVADSAVQRTAGECAADIRNFMTTDDTCGVNFQNCAKNGTDDSVFDKYFATALTETKCEQYADDSRTALTQTRDNYFAAVATNITKMVNDMANARTTKLNNTTAACTNGTAKKSCITNLCNLMPNKCADDTTENDAATSMCTYVDTACNNIKMRATVASQNNDLAIQYNLNNIK